MKYELEILDTLILYDIEPSEFADKPFDSKKFGYWKSIADTENKRIKRAFMKEVFSLKKEKYIETYIQQHQQELIRLTDHLLKYFPPQEARSIYENISDDETLLNLYRIIYHYLEGLLAYIEKHFSRYFNLKAKIPDSYKIIAIRDMEEEVELVSERLKAKEADEGLLALVVLPLKEFIQDKSCRNISFRRLIYLKELLKELSELSVGELIKEDLNKQIFCTLVYLNFNSYRLFVYCTEFMKNEYQKHETMCGQLESLALFYKNISQAQVKPSFSYKPKFKPLKDCLIEWLDEEICFLEKRRQLSLNISVRQSEAAPKDFKLITNLSVSQLAYLLKVFVDSGVILNKNQRDIIKFVSGGISTKKTESVSPDSLRSKFYNVEDSTKGAVKDLLINMLNQVRKS